MSYTLEILKKSSFTSKKGRDLVSYLTLDPKKNVRSVLCDLSISKKIETSDGKNVSLTMEQVAEFKEQSVQVQGVALFEEQK